MNCYDYKLICVDGSEALCHHGIKGQKWGVRRYQNADGSLTPEGVKRYRRKFKKIFEQAEKVYYSKEDGDLSGWNNAVGKMKKYGLSDRAVEDVAGVYLGGSLGEVLKSANAGIEKSAKKANEIASDKAYAKQDFKTAFKSLKDSGYFDEYPKEVRDGLLKAGKTSNSIEEFDKKTLINYGDHASDLLWDQIDEIRDARHATLSGGAFIANSSAMNAHMSAVRAHQNMVEQTNIQNFVNQQIAFSNQQASLSMTYGMNPHMF